MTSALSASEQAIYDALKAGVTLAPIFQHVPQNTPPPVVIIGDLDAEPDGGKEETDKRITGSLSAICQAEEREPVLQLLDEVEAALSGHRRQIEGWSLYVLVDSSGANLLPDGETYVGTVQITVLASED